MTSLRPARLLPALVVFALTTGTAESEADACMPRDDSRGFFGLSLASSVAPIDGGILVFGNARGITPDQIASELAMEAKVGDRVVPIDASVFATEASAGLVHFTLQIVPKEALPAGTKLTLDAKTATTIAPSGSFEATIGNERIADLDTVQLSLVASAREQVPDITKTATCVKAAEATASGCGGLPEPERKFQPRFVWAHTARYSLESSWRAEMVGAYTSISLSVPSVVEAPPVASNQIATRASGRVCVDATITLRADPSRKWTRQACLDLAALPEPTADEQAAFEEKSLGGLKCSSIHYADGTTTTPPTTTPGDASSSSADESSGCSVGSHAGSPGTTSAFGALVALAMAGAARLRRRR